MATTVNRLMEIRANEALVKEAPVSDFKKVFEHSRGMKTSSNPFGSMGGNPFAGRGKDSYF